MILCITSSSFFAVAEDEVPVNSVTTTIEQPATIVAPAAPVAGPAAAQPMTNGKAAPSSGNVSSALSTFIDNQGADMKKCAEMLNNLSSQIKELQDQTMTMNTTLQSMEEMAKSNVKIVISCLIALLVLSVILLFKKCSCGLRPSDTMGK